MPPVAPIYIHIPKTAGTSILTALGERRGLHRPVQDPGFQKRVRKVEANGRRPLLFTVFREPVERMVSMFHYYHSMDLSRPRTQENVLLAHIAKAYPDCDAFWRGVDPPSLANASVMFKNQRWFFRKAKRPVTVVPFTDRLAASIKRLVGIDIPHLNRTRHGSPEDELSPDTIAKLRTWMNGDVEYWRELMARHDGAAEASVADTPETDPKGS